jgi:long-chain acyl-CoA synthetase
MLDKGSRTVINLLQKAASDFEHDPYLSYKTRKGWRSYTYKEIYANALAIGASLKKLGIEKNDCIAIISEGSPMWVTAEFGILSTGAISVPLSVKLLAEEIPYRFNHAEVKAVFTSHNHLDKILEIDSLIENKDMFIIYLDEDISYFYDALEMVGINTERGVSYWKMLKDGEALLRHDPTFLEDRLNAIKEDDVVNISYTSGTTGNPKGIMLTHLNYYSNAKDGTSIFKLKKGFRTLIILPIDHSFAHTVAIYGALFAALDIYFLDTWGGMVNALKNIPINLQEVKPQFLLTVPALSGNFIKKMKEGVEEKGSFVNKIFMNGLNAGQTIFGNGFEKTSLFKRIINFFPYKLASLLIFKKLKAVFGGELEYMVGGGALLDIKQQQFYYCIGNPVFQGYGLTEAAPIISANTPFVHKLGTSGKIMPSIICKIVKENGEEAAIGEKGEIVIQGDNVMKGYYKNEEATQECIRDGWLWTGDIGYMDKDDFLVVSGRNKALLISEDGEKYSPEGIEEAIVNSAEIIEQAMVYNDHKKHTSAVVTVNPNKIIKLKHHSPEKIVELLKADMHRFKKNPAYSGQFPEKWTPSALFIAPEPFTEDNKMINSTLKMVRHQITSHYKNEIDIIYSSEGSNKIKHLNQQMIQRIIEN